ncbi:MAG: hypothetical protein WDM77_03505 [Steroidobacteraceae bacterium]
MSFPTPGSLAHADLAPLGMPRSRAATLSSVAAAAMADPDLFGARCDLEEAIERLRSIRGVGEWTAQYIALRQLREPDAFPAADVGLMRALTDPTGRRPSAPQLLARAETVAPLARLRGPAPLGQRLSSCHDLRFFHPQEQQHSDHQEGDAAGDPDALAVGNGCHQPDGQRSDKGSRRCRTWHRRQRIH